MKKPNKQKKEAHPPLSSEELIEAYKKEFTEYLNRSVSNRWGRSPAKSSIIKSINNLMQAMTKNQNLYACIIYQSLDLYTEFFEKPYDVDIRIEAWNSMLNIINVYQCSVNESNKFLKKALEDSLRNKERSTPETRRYAFKLCDILFQIVEKEDFSHFVYWWEIIGHCILPYFFNGEGTEDIRSIRDEVALDFIKLIVNAIEVQKFPKEQIFTDEYEFPIHNFESIFASVYSYLQKRGDAKSVDLIYRFFDIFFPSIYKKSIQQNPIPEIYQFVIYSPLYSSCKTLLNLLQKIEPNNLNLYIFLMNISFFIIYFLFKQLRITSKSNKEYEYIQERLFLHILRVNNIFHGITKIEDQKKLFSIVFNSQTTDMIPFMLVFYISILLTQKEADLDMEEFSKFIERSVHHDKILTENLMQKVISQLAIVFSITLFNIKDGEIVNNPVLYEYQKIKFTSNINIENSFFYFVYFSKVNWSKESITLFLNELFKRCDPIIENGISWVFSKTLLEIKKTLQVNAPIIYEFLIPYLLQMLYKKINIFQLKVVYDLIQEAFVSKCLNYEMSRDWIMVLKKAITEQTFSLEIFILVIETFLKVIPLSLALGPLIVNAITNLPMNVLDDDQTSLLVSFLISFVLIAYKIDGIELESTILMIGITTKRRIVEKEMENMFFLLLISLVSKSKPYGQLLTDLFNDLFNFFLGKLEDNTIGMNFLLNMTILAIYSNLIHKRMANFFKRLIKTIEKCLQKPDIEIEMTTILVQFLIDLMTFITDRDIFVLCYKVLTSESIVKKRLIQKLIQQELDSFLLHFRKINGDSSEIQNVLSKIANMENKLVVISKNKRFCICTFEQNRISITSTNPYGSSSYEVTPIGNAPTCKAFPQSFIFWSTLRLMNGKQIKTTIPDKMESYIDDISKYSDQRPCLNIGINNAARLQQLKSFKYFLQEIRKIHHPRFNVHFTYPLADADVCILWLEMYMDYYYYVDLYENVKIFIFIQEKRNGLFLVNVYNRCGININYGLLPDNKIIIPIRLLPFAVGWTGLLLASALYDKTQKVEDEEFDTFFREIGKKQQDA